MWNLAWDGCHFTLTSWCGVAWAHKLLVMCVLSLVNKTQRPKRGRSLCVYLSVCQSVWPHAVIGRKLFATLANLPPEAMRYPANLPSEAIRKNLYPANLPPEAMPLLLRLFHPWYCCCSGYGSGFGSDGSNPPPAMVVFHSSIAYRDHFSVQINWILFVLFRISVYIPSIFETKHFVPIRYRTKITLISQVSGS